MSAPARGTDASIDADALSTTSLGSLHRLRQRADALERSLRSVHDAMSSLCDEFNARLSRPPAHLAIRNIRGVVGVHWRARAYTGNQSFFRLTDSERGISVMRDMSVSMRSVFLSFEVRRIELNARYRLLHYEHKVLNDLMQQRAAASAWRDAN